MNITLKNIKYAAFASQETYCFEATIYIDGVKAGTASNDGRGGSNYIHPHSLAVIIDNHAKTLPKWASTSTPVAGITIAPEMHEWDADMLITDLVTVYLREKDFRRAISKRVLFTKDGEDGVYQTASMSKSDLDKVMENPDYYKKHLKADKILNLLPMAEALALYAKTGS